MKFSKLKKKAFVLPLVVVVIVLLLLIGYALGVVGFEARVQSYRKTYDVYAREAADAGLSQAIYKMNEKLAAESIWTDSLSSLAESNISLANSNSKYSFKITGSWPSGYTIESVGTNKNATRRVFAIVKLESIFNFAILTKRNISLYPNSTVTAYNSDTGATGLHTQIATNSTYPGSVILLNGATVTGDVLVGVGSEPSEVINNKGTITGTTAALPQTLYMPPVYPPTGLTNQGAIKNSTVIDGSGSGVYSSIYLGNGESLTIDEGDVVLYVTGDIRVDNSSALVIDEDASLKIYLDGNWESKNGAEFNIESENPSQFQIFGTSTTTQSIDIKAKNDYYGTIYAPVADLEIKAGGDIYGSFVGNTFESKSKSTFSYDTELGEVGINNEGVYFAIMNWREE